MRGQAPFLLHEPATELVRGGCEPGNWAVRGQLLTRVSVTYAVKTFAIRYYVHKRRVRPAVLGHLEGSIDENGVLGYRLVK